MRRPVDPIKNTWLNDNPFCDNSNSNSGLGVERVLESDQNMSHDALQTELLHTIVTILAKLTDYLVPQTEHHLGNHIPNQTSDQQYHKTTSCHVNPPNHHVPEPQEWTTVKRRSTRPVKEQHISPDFEINNKFNILANHESRKIDVLNLGQEPQSNAPKYQQPTLSTKQKSKPQIIINENPESVETWQKTVPGNTTYSNTVKCGRAVMIYSDSICNRMSKWELNKKVTSAGINCQINKKPFVGATSEDLHTYHMLPTLKNNTPDEVLIHTGINDTKQLADKDGGMSSEVIDLIANSIIRCGQVARYHGVNRVCISAVLPMRGKKYQKTISLINYRIENLCKREGFDFITNVNIIFSEPTPIDDGLFYKDGLHLNAAGRQVLMDNFIEYLNMH